MNLCELKFYLPNLAAEESLGARELRISSSAAEVRRLAASILKPGTLQIQASRCQTEAAIHAGSPMNM